MYPRARARARDARRSFPAVNPLVAAMSDARWNYKLNAMCVAIPREDAYEKLRRIRGRLPRARRSTCYRPEAKTWPRLRRHWNPARVSRDLPRSND